MKLLFHSRRLQRKILDSNTTNIPSSRYIPVKMAERLAGYEHYHSFMDKLTEAGVDDYIDLPMIAVMGDTSSGKSSVSFILSTTFLCFPRQSTSTDMCMMFLFVPSASIKHFTH